MVTIPLFDLNFDEAEENAVLETLRSKWISTGPKTALFETEFANALGVKYALALSNCTAALHLAMLLCEIKEGDEIICPSLTFVATVNAIKYVRAIPVFCDIHSSEDPTIDAFQIEFHITSKTKGIIVMHQAGYSCDMDKIMKLAKKYDLKVIEDACHGPLSEFNDKKLGTIGAIGCFSFFSNKNMSTGEGGMLVTNNENIFLRAKLFRSHGMTATSYDKFKGHSSDYDIISLGYNYRMEDIRASIGLVQLQKLLPDLQIRAKLRTYFIKQLEKIPDIIIPFKDNHNFSSNYIFLIVLEKGDFNYRDSIRKRMKESGIQTSVHYPAVHRFSLYNDIVYNLPNTEYFADHSITLPFFSKLTHNQIDYIVSTLKNAL